MNVSDLVGVLEFRAHETNSLRVPAYRFLKTGDIDGEVLTLSFAELATKARAIGAAISKRVAPGERAVLAYPAGLEFIAAFYGCLYAGVLAVPVAQSAS